MATVTFAVGVPAGAPQGTVDGQSNIDISSYLALYPTGATLPNNVIYCIAPDTPIANGMSTYTIQNGITGGLNSIQAQALKGLFSNYFDLGNTSFAAQEATMLADWSIVNPSLTVSGVPSAIVAQANLLKTEALGGTFTVNPNLDFITLVNNNGHQDFIEFYDPVPTPIPPSVGLFIAALAILAGIAMRKKAALRAIRIQARR